MAAIPATESESQLYGINKRMRSFGRGLLPEFPDNTKVEIYWQSKVVRDNDDESHASHQHGDGSNCSCSVASDVLDDSRRIFGKDTPMCLVLGRSFRLPCLESCVKTMCLGEVAEFIVTDPKLTSAYPAFAASLRSIAKHQPTRGHCCAAMAQAQGMGYSDLDELIRNPNLKLQFTIELVAIHYPGSYNLEKWQMSDDQRVAKLEKYRQEGNKLVAAKEWRAAASLYSEALESLDLLCSRDKPGEPEWKEYDDKKTVFFLNLAQCQLQLEDYLGAIESCRQVLRRDQQNIKAYFRRARAYAKLWESEAAFSDWAEVVRLDPTLTQTVMRESNDFKQKLDAHNKAEAEKLKAAFAPK